MDNERLKRVISNLRAKTGLENKYGPPQSLEDRLAYYNTPGMSIAVINNFEIDWASGFGLCESGRDHPVTTRTLFQSGSISKPIFALGVMRLVEKGVIDLDEDVNNYLTSWRVPANNGWQPKITLRQLLSHSVGVTVHGFLGYTPNEAVPTVPQLLNGEPPANSAKIEVNLLPGLQTRYSGGGTTIAQQVVVDVTGKSLPEVMRELVFDPLGMENSSYEQPLSSWAGNGATGHHYNGDPLMSKYQIYPEMGAAGLWTTASDLALAGMELLKITNNKPSEFLSKQTVDSMLQPQIAEQGKEKDYSGLGFFCQETSEEFCFLHAGSNVGFSASFQMLKNSGNGFVVLTNSDLGFPLIEEIKRSIAEEYDWPKGASECRNMCNLAQSISYTGEYKTDSELHFSITSKENTLILKLPDQPPVDIFPTSTTEFFSRVTNTKISFEVNDINETQALTISQGGASIRASKS